MRRNASPGSEQLRAGYCYRWRLTLIGADGRRTSVYSGAVLTDPSPPRAPTVQLTAEAARVNLDRLGVNEAYVGHSGMLWVRAGVSGSVAVDVRGFDRQSGIAANVARIDGSGWSSRWIGSSADGALRLTYGPRGGVRDA